MSTTTELEDRLRRGLQAAGEALPAAAHEPPTPGGRRPARGPRHARSSGHQRPAGGPGRGRGRWGASLAAVGVAAAALVAVVAVVATRAGGDTDRGPSVRSARQGTTTTTAPHVPEPAGGDRPGAGVVVDDVVHTWDGQGRETGTIDLAPLTNVQAASSDLQGGWVACGNATVDPAETPDLPPGATPTRTLLVWFPAGGEPVPLHDTQNATCMADSVQVVDAPEGPTAVYMSNGVRQGALFGWDSVVLATGAVAPVAVTPPVDFWRWSAATGRLAVHTDATGLRLYDLASGAEVPTAAIDVRSPSDVSLAPDAASVAVVTGGVSGPTDVVVYDLATGQERFRETTSIPAEGAELSYDGRRLAFGNWYEGNGPATIVDLETGDRYEVATHGLLL